MAKRVSFTLGWGSVTTLGTEVVPSVLMQVLLCTSCIVNVLPHNMAFVIISALLNASSVRF
jgi:hypothetical protein